jgi:hypothetical protein
VDHTAQEILAIIKQDKDIQSGNKAKILAHGKPSHAPKIEMGQYFRFNQSKNLGFITRLNFLILLDNCENLLRSMVHQNIWASIGANFSRPRSGRQ